MINPGTHALLSQLPAKTLLASFMTSIV